MTPTSDHHRNGSGVRSIVGTCMGKSLLDVALIAGEVMSDSRRDGCHRPDLRAIDEDHGSKDHSHRGAWRTVMEAEDEVDFGVSQFRFESDAVQLETARFPIIDASSNTTRSLPCLKEEGVKTVIRYYCSEPRGSWKVVRPPEAKSIISAGLELCIVHEASANPSYFSYASGLLDGEFSCHYGQSVIGQPRGSAIYFAIDFDADRQTLRDRVIPYFEGVIEKVKAAGSPYRIGVYGSGLTCRTLLDEKMVEFAWLAQSTGWREYASFKATRRWALLQKPTTHACGIEVDFDEASIPDFGAFGQLDGQVAASDDVDTFDDLRAASALDGLEEGFKAKAVLLIKECAAKGIKMVPYFGLRSPREQAKLWRQSRSGAEIAVGVRRLRDGGAPWLAAVLEATSTNPGRHVTNALPGMSWHQWGEALDCYREINGKANWDEKNYVDYANIAESRAVGLTAGGHWSKFKDWPHVQLRPQAGPQNLYSYATIDAKMKEMWSGNTADALTQSRMADDGGERTAGLVASIISALSEATRTEIKVSGDQRPYFFPNGIFEIDVAVGVLADPPSGGAAEGSPPGISGRVVISGRDKA